MSTPHSTPSPAAADPVPAAHDPVPAAADPSAAADANATVDANSGTSGPTGAKDAAAANAAGADAAALEEWEEPPVPPAELADLFNSFEKAARARRLYHSNNPMYQSFVGGARAAVERLWTNVASLHIGVEESGFVCYELRFSAAEGRENLAFLFYKDGIRSLTLVPGFEDELERFLHVVTLARQLDQKAADDMVTLLWEQEFTSLQYGYVDMLAEGLQLPERGPAAAGASIDTDLLRADIQNRLDQVLPPTVQAGAPPVATAVSADQFVETLYFLESHELEQLQREVEHEWQRDTKSAVLDALFDRLEDRRIEWQREILNILRQLMPVFLSRGDLRSAARVLVETTALREAGVFDDAERRALESLFAELSRPDVLGELLRALAEGSIEPADADLSVFLAHLGADALALLIRAAETADSAALKERLRVAIEGLAGEHRPILVELIDAVDAVVALGATRLAGKLDVAPAAPRIADLYRRGSAEARRVAIDALVRIRSSSAMGVVQEAIEDDDREVRITAARGLGAMRYQPARANIESVIQTRRLADADLTEQIAFFEAYGAIAPAEGVRLLDRMLNGRRMFGKMSNEMRACAAMALGRIATPEARESLLGSASDTHPMVRSAVAKALAGIAK